MAGTPLLVNKTELARILGISTKTVSRYQTEGLPFTGKGQSARFDVTACVQWYAQKQAQIAMSQVDIGKVSLSEEEVKVRKLLAEAQMKELELAQMRGELVLVEDAEKEITRHLTQLRGKVTAIPGVWGAKVLGLKDIHEAVDILSDLVDRLMHELANDEEGDGLDEEDSEADVDESATDLAESEDDEA